MKTLTAAEIWTDIDVPEDGDDGDFQTAASFTDGVGFQNAADRDEYLKALVLGSGVAAPAIDKVTNTTGIGRIRSVNSTGILSTITPDEGDIYEVRASNGSGSLYVGTKDTTLPLAGTMVLSAPAGRWVAVGRSLWGVAWGFAPLGSNSRLMQDYAYLPTVATKSVGSGYENATSGFTTISDGTNSLTTTLNVLANRPVHVGFSAADGATPGWVYVTSTSATQTEGIIQIDVTGPASATLGSSFIGVTGTSGASMTIPPSIQTTWTPTTAGSYTFTVQAKLYDTGSGRKIGANNCKLVVFQY